MNEHLPECPVWRCCKPDERATMHMCICSDEAGIPMTHDPLCPNVKHPDGCLCCEIGAPCIYCELIAKVREETFATSVQRVEALPHSLECVTRDANYSRPCNCLRGDALDAIKGD